MRLLLLSTEFPPGPGGIGTHAYQLCKGLARHGWKITVVTRQDYARQAERLSFNESQDFEILSVPEISLTPLDAFYRWYICQRTILARGIELIVATGSQSVWLSTMLPRKTVVIGHGTEFGANGLKGSLTRQAFERANHVICVSEFTNQYMHSKSIKPKSVSVIHNGADAEVFHQLPYEEIQAARRELGFSEADDLLLTVGNVTSRKGQDVVIRSLPRVLAQHPNTHYLVAGLPTLKSELSLLASELGVSDRVHFLGKVSTAVLLKLYNACQIFIMTSRHTEYGDFEGYGIAVVEAALCGKASIVSGDSGLAEAVLDGESGLIVPQNDHEKTSLAISTLLSDRELLHILENRAKARAITNGTWSTKVNAYNAVLSGIVNP